MPDDPFCPVCAKFVADWRDALHDLSRRNAVYAASATALDEHGREEEAFRIEGAKLRAEGALAAMQDHCQLHSPAEEVATR